MRGWMPIYFDTTTDAYGCFSNFSRHGFELDGRYWPTVEHYFQAQKFAGTEYIGHVARARTPKEAAERGRSRAVPSRPDWEAVKDGVMRAAVRLKFETHADIRAVLVGTGEGQGFRSTGTRLRDRARPGPGRTSCRNVRMMYA